MSANATYHTQSVNQHGCGDISEALGCIDAQVAPLFRRRDWQRRAEQYVRALLTAPAARRNAENLAAAIDGATPRAFQRFLSESPWDHRPIIDQVQAMLRPLLQSEQGIWVLKEITFAKQGEHSVGVARQLSPQHPTRRNCQVGVFLTYAAPLGQALIDMHLYLPRPWSENAARRHQGSVPDSVVYHSKAELALMMLRDARARGQLSSQWVTGAGEVGQDIGFRDTLDAEGWLYLLEVSATMPVFRTTDWHTQRILSHGNSRRRGPGSSLSCPPFPRKIRDLATSIPPGEWKHLILESATGSEETSHWAARRIWEVRDGQPGRQSWLLLCRDHQWAPVTSYFSNAPAAMTLETLAQVSIASAAARTVLAQTRMTLGLADYEVRSWSGWHHHMSLCLLAGAFLMQHGALCEL